MKTLVETAWGFNIQLAPIPFPFSMSYPSDWYYQMHYTAVNSPWKWLGLFGGADVFQSPHHWLSPKPQSPSSPSPPPSFAPPRVWQRQRGWGVGVEQREEEGDVIEGWNHTIPQGGPQQPSSILSAVQSRRSIRKTRPLTCIWMWPMSVRRFFMLLRPMSPTPFLSLIRSQHHTVIFRLGMCYRQAIRPSCPSLALTAVFVCDMQMSPFFFFLLFEWRLVQGVGKGVCLLWLWN